jgi:Domain of unknown function (DUF4864)
VAWLGRERVRASGGWSGRSAKCVAVLIVTASVQARVARASVSVPGDVAGQNVSGEVRLADGDPLTALGGPKIARDPAPEPGLGPDAVIGIMLKALQHNDDPVIDHGINVTFAFTSPENRDVTGPINRFRALVKSSAYRAIIGHAKADRGPVMVVAQHARERVEITGAHGERATYLFLLSRQETGTYKGCWMADGVLREVDGTTEMPDPVVTTVVYRRD